MCDTSGGTAYNRKRPEKEVGADTTVKNDNKDNTASGAETRAEAFARLYEQYLPGVFRFVYYRVGNQALAEDVTSEVFHKALTAFPRYDSAKASFSTWIYTIARNTLTDYFRKHARETRLREETEEDVPSETESVEEQLTKAEEFRKLHRCLSELRKHEQEIVSLKFAGGMTNREIAAVTGLTESNVGTILCRTIRKLRDEFIGWQ
jgi:RNA polymerase sigma-70 factor (ECF subfamily)